MPSWRCLIMIHRLRRWRRKPSTRGRETMGMMLIRTKKLTIEKSLVSLGSITNMKVIPTMKTSMSTRQTEGSTGWREDREKSMCSSFGGLAKTKHLCVLSWLPSSMQSTPRYPTLVVRWLGMTQTSWRSKGSSRRMLRTSAWWSIQILSSFCSGISWTLVCWSILLLHHLLELLSTQLKPHSCFLPLSPSVTSSSSLISSSPSCFHMKDTTPVMKQTSRKLLKNTSLVVCGLMC